MLLEADSMNYSIPEGWEITRFGNVAKIKRGASPRPIADPIYFGKGRGWIRISDVTKSSKYLERTEDYLSDIGESKSVPVNEGDIIMSIAATVGKPIILKMKACIHDGFVVFSELNKSMDREFLYYLLNQIESKLKSLGQHGTQSNINAELVAKIEFLKPPLLEQQKIASILSNVDSLIQQTQKEIEQTQRLKKGLMQRLLTKGIGHKKFKNSEIGKIPQKWNTVRLEEACLKSKNSFSMGPFGSDIKTDNFVQSGVPVIRGVNLTKQPFYENGFVFVTENKADELKAANAFSGDLIFTHRGTLGQVGVIPFNSKFKRYVISQSQMKCTCDTYILDPMFAFYFFNSNPGQKIIMTHSTKSGVPHIIQPLTSLRSFFIPLPEIKEQKIIVNFISETNSLVETQQEYKSKLETLKKGLMQKLFTGQIRVKV